MRQILTAAAIFLAATVMVHAKDEPPYRQRVSDEATVVARTKKFATEMKRLGFNGEILSCKSMVQQAVGVRGGNISYGAICLVQTDSGSQNVMMCDDDGVGHYGLKAFTFVMTEDAVAEFTKRNCYGS